MYTQLAEKNTFDETYKTNDTKYTQKEIEILWALVHVVAAEPAAGPAAKQKKVIARPPLPEPRRSPG